MFGKNFFFEKEQHVYNKEAQNYIDNPKKTLGLLNKAIQMANERKDSLGEARDKLQLFFDLIKAYSKGEYKDVSKGTIVSVIGAILYFVSPLDFVPDFIIGLGIIDDAAVIGFTLKKISKELEGFRKWKNTTSIEKNPLDL
ncbi:YkvA family protein [Neobacillus rhizosphaerae]|uniref:YkvA family protein n=1 Tax=Neobacillus rhizosphaerae TaxID=2880965 RepID=UPI003D2D61F6